MAHPISRSRCRGRLPQPGDQRRGFPEHLPGQPDLGYLKRDAPWLTTLEPILISSLAQYCMIGVLAEL
jgi:hypothetical protein